MNEVKTPKKPVINFWIGALMVLLCINIFLKPYIQKMQIQDVKYSTFISQTEKKQESLPFPGSQGLLPRGRKRPSDHPHRR